MKNKNMNRLNNFLLYLSGTLGWFFGYSIEDAGLKHGFYYCIFQIKAPVYKTKLLL